MKNKLLYIALFANAAVQAGSFKIAALGGLMKSGVQFANGKILPGETKKFPARDEEVERSGVTFGGLIAYEFTPGNLIFGLEGGALLNRAKYELATDVKDVEVKILAKPGLLWFAGPKVGVRLSEKLQFDAGFYLALSSMRVNATSELDELVDDHFEKFEKMFLGAGPRIGLSYNLGKRMEIFAYGGCFFFKNNEKVEKVSPTERMKLVVSHESMFVGVVGVSFKLSVDEEKPVVEPQKSLEDSKAV